jgi:MFS family permease
MRALAWVVCACPQTLIASFANAGLYSMILSGLILEYVGPRYSFLIGGCLASVGYLILWAIASLKMGSNIAGTCMSTYLATFGTSFFSITCTTLVVCNFPTRDRGKAVGIMKAFLGLGISINSQFYSTFFEVSAI